ncbi:MAG: UDP-3-O-acyl-N-acetylglucosamine deacetylase [Fretibacterium sp.]|nr:UDP-3-O-acyl-N-acetylglucosamine deacetylase [Fretibacterium sp.]
MKRFRRLTRPVVLSGRGLHSGADCSCVIEPSETGLSLSAGGGPDIPLYLLALAGDGRGSDCIFPDGTRIRTCEHVLAALAGTGVWCASIRVEGPEMPALDGCALEAAEQIFECSEQAHGPAPLDLPFAVKVGDTERFVAAFPASNLALTCVVSYDSPFIGSQIFDFKGGAECFLKEIAPARTFAKASELETLREQGMALGGTSENAILVGEDGVRAKGGLRWSDEFVRHKVLDLIGDLAVLGRPLNAHVVAVRGGHSLHLRLAERLKALAGPSGHSS